ncbi:MAG: hypothetical protein ACRDF4_00390 [Rhabdochlamydiaceae bacterium]
MGKKVQRDSNGVDEKTKRDNKKMTRKEEPTLAPTPDKLDRAAKEPASIFRKQREKPYPLTEEEATPSTPKSEEQKGSLADSG